MSSPLTWSLVAGAGVQTSWMGPIAMSLGVSGAVVVCFAWLWRAAAAWDRARSELVSDHPVIGGQR